MKFRAAVLEQFGQPLVVQEVDLAPPMQGEVLVKLQACGVCHTDLYTQSGADPSGYCNCVLGHEGAGIVAEIGAGVITFKPHVPDDSERPWRAPRLHAARRGR